MEQSKEMARIACKALEEKKGEEIGRASCRERVLQVV